MTNDSNTTDSYKSGLSVVLAVHDQAEQIRRNLPIILLQDYGPGYEVIVVDESSTDDTEDVLKQLKAQYPHLYTTYIPASSHYVSRRKLALTIGMKAAHNEWVIITEASCHPDSDSWLRAMAEAMNSEVDAVCAYTPFDKGIKATYAYSRMITWWRQFNSPYRYDGACLAIRKSAFMARNGFLKNLQFLRSEYDFLVNETPKSRIAVISTPECRMRQEPPTKKEWTNRQLYHMQSRHALRRAFFHRLFFFFMQAFVHLGYLFALAFLAFAIYRHDMLFTVGAALILLLLLALHSFFGHWLAKKCGEHIAFWKQPFLHLGVAWQFLYYRIRFMSASKYDFIRK